MHAEVEVEPEDWRPMPAAIARLCQQAFCKSCEHRNSGCQFKFVVLDSFFRGNLFGAIEIMKADLSREECFSKPTVVKKRPEDHLAKYI